jgi:PAS domain S-box-containing protein
VRIQAFNGSSRSFMSIGQDTNSRSGVASAPDEHASQTLKMRWQEAQSLAHVGVWEWFVDSDEVHWSDELYRIYGLDPGATPVTSGFYFSKLHPEDRHRVRQKIEDALKSRGEFSFEERILRPDGSIRHLQSRGRTIHTESGKVVGMIGACHDITDQKIAEHKLLEAQKELEERVQDRSDRLDRAQKSLRESERFSELVIESSRDCIKVLDLEGRLIYMSGSGQKILELEDFEAVRGRLYVDFWGPEFRSLAEKAVQAANEGRVGEFAGSFASGPSQTPRWWHVVVSPIRDDHGKIFRLLAVSRDISEQKRAEEQLRHERAQLETQKEVLETLNQVGQSVAAEFGLEKIVQLVTDVATHLSGAQFGAFFYNVVSEKGERYTLYTISGVPKEAFTKFPMPRKTAIFGPTFEGLGIVRSDDITADPRYGKSAPYHGMPAGHLPVKSYLAVPVISRSGEVLGGLFFGHAQSGKFSDREERIVSGLAGQAAIAIDNSRLYQKAQEAIQARDEFLSIASHELKTPITSLSMQIQMAARSLGADTKLSPSNPKLVNSFDISMRQIKRLTNLIDNLLDVSRIQAGKLALEPEDMNLDEVIHDVCTRFADNLERVCCSVKIDCDDKLRGYWDPSRIEQVLVNLVSNSIKYAPGSVIDIAAKCDSNEATITVADKGPGIPADKVPRIFERFERAHSSRNIGGLGLGLYIARQIVEAHEGSIRVESVMGQGTKFIIKLPLRALNEKASSHEPHV